MKTLFLTLITLIAAYNAQAETLVGKDPADVEIHVGLIEDFKKVPSVGKMKASVLSVYAGSAYGLYRYVLTVDNILAPCEGDDCMVQKSFEIGLYSGPVLETYSRKVDENTYSIALITYALKVEGNSDTPRREKVKLLIRVKLTDEGIAEEADFTEVKL